MKTLKLRRWNAKTFTFLTDSDEDKVDMVLYEDGEKLYEIKASKPTKKWEEWEYTVRIPEDITEEIQEWDVEYELRANSEPFEEWVLSIFSKRPKDAGQESDKD